MVHLLPRIAKRPVHLYYTDDCLSAVTGLSIRADSPSRGGFYILIYSPGCSTDRSRLSNRCSLASSTAPLSPATPPRPPPSPSPRSLSLIGRTALARSSRILTYASQAFNAHTSTRPTAVALPPTSVHARWTDGGGRAAIGDKPTAAADDCSVPLTVAAARQH